ncbi:RNA polymerase sigma factor [soil metagenome]
MDVTDHDLARKAGKGDRAAFRHLLERHYALLYRVAYRFLGNAAEAEDVAQEVALVLASRIAGFDGRARFTTWLYQVTVNACRDHVRRRASIARMQSAFVDVAAAREADWADSGARVRWLYRALDALDPALKETALLVLAEELSHAETGAILGIKENTVSWRMHEVRKRLKTMVSESDD